MNKKNQPPKGKKGCPKGGKGPLKAEQFRRLLRGKCQTKWFQQ